MSHQQWPIREERVCCGLVKIRKIGCIYILAEWTRKDGKKSYLVLGPYWHFLVVTLIALAAITGMVYGVVIPEAYASERFLGLAFAVLAIASLLATAVCDPGIFPRYSKPLAMDWTFSEYAQSYRPPGVIYCQQCQVLIEDYNHFCPWSGIVIGKGNEPYFRVFVVALTISLLYDTVLIACSLHQPS